MEYDLHLTAGIISAAACGIVEKRKVERLVAELSESIKATEGVPQHLLFDRTGRLLNQSYGEMKDLQRFFGAVAGNSPKYHDHEPGR